MMSASTIDSAASGRQRGACGRQRCKNDAVVIAAGVGIGRACRDITGRDDRRHRKITTETQQPSRRGEMRFMRPLRFRQAAIGNASGNSRDLRIGDDGRRLAADDALSSRQALLGPIARLTSRSPRHCAMAVRAWARSSAVEHTLHTGGVTGSIPVAPTTPRFSSINHVALAHR